MHVYAVVNGSFSGNGLNMVLMIVLCVCVCVLSFQIPEPAVSPTLPDGGISV